LDEIVRVTDRWGRVIVLTEDRWRTHILAGHPDFGNDPALVADVLTGPDIVTHDRTYPDREVFYAASPLPSPMAHLLLRVVVRFGEVNRVITAHLIEKPHRKEQQKWP